MRIKPSISEVKCTCFDDCPTVSFHGKLLIRHVFPLENQCFQRLPMFVLFQMLCYQAVDQVLCLISSVTISFANEAPARTSLAFLVLDIFRVVCDIFERGSAQDLLAPLIETFFSCFELCASPNEPDGSMKQPCANEIRETFTASLAYDAYIPLCKSLGDTFMGTTLKENYDVIWQLCCTVDKALSNHTPSATAKPVSILSDEETENDQTFKVKLPPNATENSERSSSLEKETRSDAKSFMETRYNPFTSYLA